MRQLGIVIAIVLLTVAASLRAFYPGVSPRLYNSWYALVGMETRVSANDYEKWSVRSIGIAVLILELGIAVYRLFVRGLAFPGRTGDTVGSGRPSNHRCFITQHLERVITSSDLSPPPVEVESQELQQCQ